MHPATTFVKDQSIQFDGFQAAYEYLGRVCSGIEMVRLELGCLPDVQGKPLFMPIFTKQASGTIVAEARLMFKQDKRLGIDKRVMLVVVAARLFNDGERFRVDVHSEGSWDEAYWGVDDSQRIREMHGKLAAIAASPPSMIEGAMPTSLLILSQELSARRNAVVTLVHLKDTLYCLTASTTWRRSHDKDPEIILYYDATGGGKVGVQFLKKHHVDVLSKAARVIEHVDLDLAEKIAQLSQDRLITQARQRYAARDMAIMTAFNSSYLMSEIDPMFVYFAVQSLDAFGSSLRAVGGSLRFDGTSITGAGRTTRNLFTDPGSISAAFDNVGGDDNGIGIILLIIGIIVFIVTIGLVVWGILKVMTRAENGDASMTYYISWKGKIHKYRTPRIYSNDLRSK